MKILIPLTALTFFIWLAVQQPAEHGYTQQERDAIGVLYQQSDEEIIMDLWNIKEPDLRKPVDIFHESQCVYNCPGGIYPRCQAVTTCTNGECQTYTVCA